MRKEEEERAREEGEEREVAKGKRIPTECLSQ